MRSSRNVDLLLRPLRAVSRDAICGILARCELIQEAMKKITRLKRESLRALLCLQVHKA